MSEKHEETVTAVLTPTGKLIHLTYKDLTPNISNPRRLFDPEPLKSLRENIRLHGVLVPLTVHKLPGADKYGIIDGARRHLCCKDLAGEGVIIKIPCNVVSPPSKVAGLLYMFNIHNFREPWDLMPTAMGLETVVGDLGETDTKKLSHLTGLSEPQVERCKILFSLADEFRQLSLDPNPRTRIPSNFWIEAMPVVDLAKEFLPELYKELTRRGLLRRLVEKYRLGKIKSVIHFRRIVEAHENTKGATEGRKRFLTTLEKYIQTVELETRAAFDGFVEDTRKVNSALQACEDFVITLKKTKVEHVTERREDLIHSLREARTYIDQLLSSLEGSDDPRIDKDEATAADDE